MYTKVLKSGPKRELGGVCLYIVTKYPEVQGVL